jgi:DNA-binding XRE family transcriptional regulator
VLLDHRGDPSALRFLIGHDLRASRERAGITQTVAGKAIGCSHSKIVYLETGKTQQRPDEVTALLRCYGADVEHVDRMASLAGRADQSTWWASFTDVLPNWFKTFVGLEGLASAEFVYEPLVVPGQLHTEDYAAALLDGHLRVPPMEVQQVVRGRLARQRVTDETEPLIFRAVIEEYVLDRIVGGPAVMRAQLRHLLDTMTLDNVELHVMPVGNAVHDGLDGEFLLLDFLEAQSIGYIEYPNGAIYVQDQDQTELYALTADRMCGAALSESDSMALIASRLDDLDRIVEA